MDERWRFFNSGFSKCSKCGEEGKDLIQETQNVEACRMNGDAYGVVMFSCKKCEWKTSFKFDEAADVYYFETSSWKRGIENLTVSSLHVWASSHPLLGVDLARVLLENLVDGSIIRTISPQTTLGIPLSPEQLNAIVTAVDTFSSS